MLEQTLNWFQLAVPQPTDKNRVVQVGVHFEEVSEMMVAMGDCRPDDMMMSHAHIVAALGAAFKNGDKGAYDAINKMEHEDKVALLDSLCDQIVTAVGVAHMMGFDILNAMSEVNRSNFSKFDRHSKPIFNEQGKIVKSEWYSPPNLVPFVPKG